MNEEMKNDMTQKQKQNKNKENEDVSSALRLKAKSIQTTISSNESLWLGPYKSKTFHILKIFIRILCNFRFKWKTTR